MKLCKVTQGALLSDMGGADVEPSPWMSGGFGVKISERLVEIATLELFCFLGHHNNNSYAYTFVTGCMYLLHYSNI